MSYPGGKAGAGTYQKIINLMPPHTAYFEPFLGNAAVMRYKRPAALNVGVDLDPASPGLAWMATKSTIAGNGDKRRRASSDRAMSADAVRIVRNGDASGILANSSDARSRQPGYLAICDDGISLLASNRFRLTPTDLVYCDPPYVMSTRAGGRLYRHEMSDRQHRQLLRCCRTLPCRVIVSGYWSSLYAETLRDWNTIHFEAMTRGGHTATEWVWFNFERPVELHDYRYLGQTFRERERIGRKQARWTARLAKMDPLERQALMAAIAGAPGLQSDPQPATASDRNLKDRSRKDPA